MAYPQRGIGPDGRKMVGLKLADAVFTVGGMALEFVVQPETWPVFFEFLCKEQPLFIGRDPAAVRGDVLAVLAAMPARQDQWPMRKAT